MEEDERTAGEGRHHAPWLFRGSDISRVLALSDGVFAFSMTLLVLGLAVPAGVEGPALRGYLTGSRFEYALLAYLISFVVISSWWQGHHLVFSYLRGYSRPLLRWNMLFLICVAILPFTTTVLSDSNSDPVGVEVFALVQVITGIALWAVWTYASGRARLAAPRMPASWGRYISLSTLGPPVLFAASVPFAFLDVRISEGIWLGVFVIPTVVRLRIGGREASTANLEARAP